jgi:hypothetical protein
MLSPGFGFCLSRKTFSEMFAIFAWTNTAKLGKTLRLYAKLSDKFVGNLVILKSSSAYDVLEDLCRQASQSMPHESLGVRNVVLYTNNIRLTPLGFEFKKSFTPKESKCVEAALDEARRVGRFDMMWDDGYDHAWQVVADCGVGFHVKRAHNETIRVLVVDLYDANAVIPPEVLACFRRSQADCLSFESHTQVVRDFGFMEFASCEVALCYVQPTCWFPNVFHLTLDGLLLGGRIAPGIGRLSKLRVVHIRNIPVLPDDFCDLKLRVGVFHTCNAHDMVAKVASMQGLQELYVYNCQGEPPCTIPTQIGCLRNLDILELESSFVGTIPTELGTLRNLTRLTIRQDRLDDLTIPQEVWALGIPVTCLVD